MTPFLLIPTLFVFCFCSYHIGHDSQSRAAVTSDTDCRVHPVPRALTLHRSRRNAHAGEGNGARRALPTRLFHRRLGDI